MPDDDSIRVDLIFERQWPPTDDTAERLAAAQQKTVRMLLAWRSRFPQEQAERTYENSSVGQIAISSSAKDSVQVSRQTGPALVRYEYDAARGGDDILSITAEPVAAEHPEYEIPDDRALQFEELSRILFDCERVERGYAGTDNQLLQTNISGTSKVEVEGVHRIILSGDDATDAAL